MPHAVESALPVHSHLLLKLLLGIAAILAVAAPALAGEKVLATRIWPALEYTRVTLETARPVKHEFFFVADPDRLVIDLEKVIGSPEGSSADIILKDGDELVVPKYTQEVTVIGEVPNTTSHVWAPDRTLAYYIQQSGGATKQADEGAIYIIRANGSVEPIICMRSPAAPVSGWRGFQPQYVASGTACSGTRTPLVSLPSPSTRGTRNGN